MSRRQFILASLMLVFSSLACRFAERIVFGEPTPAPTATLAPSPTLALTPTRGPSPTPAPTLTRTPVPQQPVGAACQPSDLDCIYACYDRLALVLPEEPVEPLTGIYGDSEANFELVRYRIQGDNIVEPDDLWVPASFVPYQKNSAAHARIWRYFSHLIPAENRAMLVNYLVSMRGNNYNYIAYVTPVDELAKTWEMNVNIMDASDPINLTMTLVHEYGHLITINDSQVNAEELNCKGLLTSHGCTRPASYMDDFYRAYWLKIYPEWKKIDEEFDPDTHEALLSAFYKKYEAHFVSEYAASSPVEDMAESWTAFVLASGSSYRPVAREKVTFFQNYPELVSLRQKILDNLCSYQP